MTSRDWLAVVVAMVIVAGVMLQVKRAGSPRRVRSIPDRILGDLMLCRDEGAILFGSRDLAEPGSRGPLMMEAVALRLDRKGALVGSSKVGREYVVDASCEEGKAIYALRGSLFPDGHEETELIVSTDEGENWLMVQSPSDLIGLAFRNRSAGYAWSERVIYRTQDEGRTWPLYTDAPAFLPRGGKKTSMAALDLDGNIWVKNDEAPRRDLYRQFLVRIHPDLRQDLYREISGSISAIDAGDNGRVWLTVQRSAERPTELVEVTVDAANRLSARTVKEFEPSLLVDYLKVVGSAVIVGLAKPRAGPADRFLTVSKDGGRTWKNILSPRGVRLYCALDADRIWMSDGEQDVYAP